MPTAVRAGYGRTPGLPRHRTFPSIERVPWTRLPAGAIARNNRQRWSATLPEIPDYALDMHTAKGQNMGRGLNHFFEVGAQLNPEMPDRDLSYRKRILEILGEVKTNGVG